MVCIFGIETKIDQSHDANIYLHCLKITDDDIYSENWLYTCFIFHFLHPISQATYCLLFVCHSVLSASTISPVPAPSNIVYIGWRFNIGKVNLCVSNYGCTSYKHE